MIDTGGIQQFSRFLLNLKLKRLSEKKSKIFILNFEIKINFIDIILAAASQSFPAPTIEVKENLRTSERIEKNSAKF